jgi:GNAT superfamily N-acetyltransferase
VTTKPVPFSLTDLLPDLRFERLHRSSAIDVAFAYEVKRLALGPQVAALWGQWDDEFQWPFHLRRFAERCFFRIIWTEHAIGTIALTKADRHVRFEEFYIVPSHQRRGVGTRVLQHTLNLTNNAGMAVRLVYLKANPVGALYRRNGFLQVGETETHFEMERPISAPESCSSE